MIDKKDKPEEKADPQPEETKGSEQPEESPSETLSDEKSSQEKQEDTEKETQSQQDESAEESSPDTEQEDQASEQAEEVLPPKEKASEKKQGEKPESASDEPPSKTEKKKDKKDDDFRYIIRLANTDINGEKTIVMGLTQIKGIGRHLAFIITDKVGIDRSIKIGDLNDQQIEKIKVAIEEITNYTPGWMLNHRKEIDTGKDIHLISSDVDMRLRDDVNLLKMIRCYRGIRHESGLPVRGQRTRANNRKGLALGVSKKREEKT